MRSHLLIFASVLLSRAIGSSDAFQMPRVGIVAAAYENLGPSIRAAAAPRRNGPLSKLGRLGITKPNSLMAKNKAGKGGDGGVENERILALVTTC